MYYLVKDWSSMPWTHNKNSLLVFDNDKVIKYIKNGLQRVYSNDQIANFIKNGCGYDHILYQSEKLEDIEFCILMLSLIVKEENKIAYTKDF